MKTRHLVLGLAAVLAISLAVPALGGPLSLRSSSGGIASVKLLVKKALSAASGAQELAAAAQHEAAVAQGAAVGARAAAASAEATANGAQVAAAGAQSAAEGMQGDVEAAQRTASNALDKAGDTASRLTTVEGTAASALGLAEGKVSHALPVLSQPGESIGGNQKKAEAVCPQGTSVSGGGYFTENGNATASFDGPEGNAWRVIASSPAVFSLTAWAMCLAR